MQLRKKFRQTSDEKKETPPLSVGKVLSHHTAASGAVLRASVTALLLIATPLSC